MLWHLAYRTPWKTKTNSSTCASKTSKKESCCREFEYKTKHMFFLLNEEWLAICLGKNSCSHICPTQAIQFTYYSFTRESNLSMNGVNQYSRGEKKQKLCLLVSIQRESSRLYFMCVLQVFNLAFSLLSMAQKKQWKRMSRPKTTTTSRSLSMNWNNTAVHSGMFVKRHCVCLFTILKAPAFFGQQSRAEQRCQDSGDFYLLSTCFLLTVPTPIWPLLNIMNRRCPPTKQAGGSQKWRHKTASEPFLVRFRFKACFQSGDAAHVLDHSLWHSGKCWDFLTNRFKY